jgi:hypothetical protein
MIPPTIHPSVRSAAERRIFELLRAAPGTDGWVCLHSLGLARHDTKRRGEIDFLLLTNRGVFVLEVKGGRVARSGGFWTFTDRYGQQTRKSEGPFDQASGAMFALEKDLRAHFGMDSRLGSLLLGYGVLFPDIRFDSTGTEADPRQVYDLRDRANPITAYIQRLTAFTHATQPSPRFAPRAEDIVALHEFLRADFDCVPPLSAQAEDTGRRLIELTTDQYATLDVIAQDPRCLVTGGAGSGKTMLAIEAARREAREGRRVLLLCFNRLLAVWLEAIVAAERTREQIFVSSLYRFMECLIRQSSLAEEFQTRREGAIDEALYGSLYPEYALLATLEGGFDPFDVLILDEAQDRMTGKVLDFLDACVRGGLESGRWRIFFDANNQAAVYGAFEQEALDRLRRFGQSSVLPLNCRNTRQIADETAKMSRPRVRLAARVAGLPVSYAWHETPASQVRQLRQTLADLLQRHARPGSITVLSPRRLEDSCASALADMDLEPVTEANVVAVMAGSQGRITYATVSSFKGLENDFIVLTDIDELEKNWWRSVVYVGMSRARVGLHLLLNEGAKPVYEERLRQWLEQAAPPVE